MNSLKYFLLALVFGCWGIIAWYLLDATIPGILTGRDVVVDDKPEGRFKADPVARAKYDRIHVGMALEEVEAIVGPAGGSYSSQIEHNYYIWKTETSWIRVITVDGKVTSKQFDLKLNQFDPKISIDD